MGINVLMQAWGIAVISGQYYIGPLADFKIKIL